MSNDKIKANREPGTGQSTALAVDAESFTSTSIAMFPAVSLSGPIIDAMTGEELPEGLATLFKGDISAVKRVLSINGWVPPVRGNQLIGRLARVHEADTNYKVQGGAQTRKVYTVEGVASLYKNDSSAFTKNKNDPPWKDDDWQVMTGNFWIGALQGLGDLDNYLDEWVRIHFGPYVSVGTRTRKRISVTALLETHKDVIAVSRALGIPLKGSPVVIDAPVHS